MAIIYQDGSLDLWQLCLKKLPPVESGVRIASIGCTTYKLYPDSTRSNAVPIKKSLRHVVAKMGGYYLSIDMRGKHDALIMDLSNPLVPQGFPQDQMATFDAVVDFGTIEHVKKSQVQAFMTAHELCKVGGLMAHVVPRVGHMHGDWQYTEEWFTQLASRQGYNIISLWSVDRTRIHRISKIECDGSMVCCLLRKTSSEFNTRHWMDPPKSPLPGQTWRRKQ